MTSPTPTRMERLRQLLLAAVVRGGPNGGVGGWQIGHFRHVAPAEFADQETASAVSQLFVAGLLELYEYQGSVLQFTASELAKAGERPPAKYQLPADIDAVWAESVDCLPSRPRASAILLGVASEMVVVRLAEFLYTKAKHKNLVALQTSVRRTQCISTLQSEGRSLLGLTPDQIRTVAGSLQAFTAVTWQRDEAAHRDPARLPDVEALRVTAASFPALASSILRVIPQGDD